MAENIFVTAKYLGSCSNWRLNNLTLQKLLYVAHMFSLSADGSPLVVGHFYAWDRGPVLPELYHKAKVFGASPVGNIFHEYPNLSNERAAQILDHTIHVLGTASPAQLVAVTQRGAGAWAQRWNLVARFAQCIPNADIREEGLRCFSGGMPLQMNGPQLA